MRHLPLIPLFGLAGATWPALERNGFGWSRLMPGHSLQDEGVESGNRKASVTLAVSHGSRTSSFAHQIP
ncbi:MAG: hypothetical protein LKG39_06435 [Acetobacter sp.]|nr:hypothetical protein [Acetobacter sp.]MCH4091112.1 hypothetical protein [Acetobacter sp.]MCI1300295.1 hypothetical protein [Acetobacter sp.]MCI1316037.1 hypothetical protein [Acetobacter sp.]